MDVEMCEIEKLRNEISVLQEKYESAIEANTGHHKIVFRLYSLIIEKSLKYYSISETQSAILDSIIKLSSSILLKNRADMKDPQGRYYNDLEGLLDYAEVKLEVPAEQIKRHIITDVYDAKIELIRWASIVRNCNLLNRIQGEGVWF